MPLTGAERQAGWRERRARAAGALTAEAARLRAELAEALGQLASARDEIERLAASVCQHPAAAVEGSTCRACNRELW